MNGAGSRRKGNAFERAVAKAFSNTFKETLRRVPLSGGLDIRADIYNPHDDTFPFFIECKNRKTYRLQSLMYGSSELFRVMKDAQEKAYGSHPSKKYKHSQAAIVVFKGGDFVEPMVMFDATVEPFMLDLRALMFFMGTRQGQFEVTSLYCFLLLVNKKRLNDA